MAFSGVSNFPKQADFAHVKSAALVIKILGDENCGRLNIITNAAKVYRIYWQMGELKKIKIILIESF
jgi:hypothetical protein